MKILITFVAIALVFSGLVYLAFSGWHLQTSAGDHTGYITAVERTGIFFKTETAYIKINTQSTQEDAYCVVDPQLVLSPQ